jgi:hypothetical protein
MDGAPALLQSIGYALASISYFAFCIMLVAFLGNRAQRNYFLLAAITGCIWVAGLSYGSITTGLSPFRPESISGV